MCITLYKLPSSKDISLEKKESKTKIRNINKISTYCWEFADHSLGKKKIQKNKSSYAYADTYLKWKLYQIFWFHKSMIYKRCWTFIPCISEKVLPIYVYWFILKYYTCICIPYIYYEVCTQTKIIIKQIESMSNSVFSCPVYFVCPRVFTHINFEIIIEIYNIFCEKRKLYQQKIGIKYLHFYNK